MTDQMVAAMHGARSVVLGAASVPRAGPGEAVVRVRVTGICGTDLGFWRSGQLPAGTVIGHEFSAEVTSLGEGVQGLSPGDRIVANPMRDGIGLGSVAGSFAQYVRLPSAELGTSVFRLPDSLSDEDGAMVEPFAVALHAVNRSGVVAGEQVVIFGAGPIGLCVLAALAARGVAQVLVIDPSPLRREMALRIGAAAVHDPAAFSAAAFVASHFGSKTFRYAHEPVGQSAVAFDCAGVPGVIDDALHSLAQGGRLCLVADPHEGAIAHARLLMLHEIDLRGCLAYSAGEFQDAIDLLASGQVNLAPLVTHRFALSEMAAAFAMQLDPARAVKVLVRP